MTENGNKNSPVRTLTVKNFSVIKDAKLEFGKITVLIGPQASGKSLLCRLAFFFSQYLPEFANNVARRRPSFGELSNAIQGRFSDWFPSTTWRNEESEIIYVSDAFSVNISVRALEQQPTFRFSASFPDGYDKWRTSEGSESVSEPNRALMAAPFFPSGSIYIPSGRAFFSTPNKGFVSVSQKNLDWITQRFSTEVDFDYRAMIASSAERDGLLSEFGRQSGSLLHGKVVLFNGAPQFQLSSDQRILPFDLLSSGTLELLPLLNPIGKLVSNTKFSKYFSEPDPPRGPIFIEEPESGIFPASQYDLVSLFAWLASLQQLNLSLAITTHSPYILTAFNDLIKAGYIAAERPEKSAEVEKIIPRQYWIKPGDLAAYAFDGKDGILRPIMDEETKLIDGDILDEISGRIGAEFEDLLEIQYGK